MNELVPQPSPHLPSDLFALMEQMDGGLPNFAAGLGKSDATISLEQFDSLIASW